VGCVAKVTVFYSWQSDLRNAINRGFIERALLEAAKSIAADESIAVEPVVERDTQAVPGAPQIADTIFAKIAAAEVLVCDVSLVTNAGGRPSPNPNVLVELGYGLRALGWERIVLVMNTAFGGPEQLPFDLKMRRALTYNLSEDEKDRAPARKELRGKAEAVLRDVLAHRQQPAPSAPSPKALALASIDAAKADQAARSRDFMVSLVSELDAVRAQSASPFNDEALVELLPLSAPAVSVFAEVAEATARHNATEAALALMRGLELVLQRFRFPPGRGGSYQETDFDFYRFLGHELLAIFVACLVRNERWQLAAEVLNEPLAIDTNQGRQTRNFTALSRHVALLDQRNQRLGLRRVSLHGDILKERHEAPPLNAVPFYDFVEADWFLYLRSEIQGDSTATSVGGDLWRPWSCVYAESHGTPNFILRMERRVKAEQMVTAFNVPDLATFQGRYAERCGNLKKMFRDPWMDLPESRADAIGTR
jgi:hypothetical protein